MRTGAAGFAVLAAGHACALPAGGAGGLADVVGAAALIHPAACGGAGEVHGHERDSREALEEREHLQCTH